MTLPHPDFTHLVAKSIAAVESSDAWDALSVGEKLAVAIVLNRADWLLQMDFTIAEAIQRVGPDWIALIPSVAKAVAAELARRQAPV